MNTNESSSATPYSFTKMVSLAATCTFPVTMALVLITNIINGCVLCRRTLRSSSCTHYFLASTVGTFVYLMSTPINTILTNGFGIQIYNSPFGCRFFPFITYSSSVFIVLMLVCAAIDRYCSSSASTRLRKLSEVHVARKIIVIVAILTIIYLCPFIFVVYQWNSNSYVCSQISSTSIDVYLFSRIVLYYIAAPFALAIFGALTIYNIRCQTRRVTLVGHVSLHRRTEGQLARMLIVQVGVYIVFSTPCGVAYVLVNIVPSINTPFFGSFRILTVLWQQGCFFLSIFLYIISGTVYRQELKKMFNLKGHRVHIAQR